MGKILISGRETEINLNGKNVTISKGETIELRPNVVKIGTGTYKTTLEDNLEIEGLITVKTECINRIYDRYDHLATYYANKLWNNTDSAIQKKDLIQELRIRLFTSIQTYLDKWTAYRTDGGVKPIPLDFYLRTVMINKSKDLIKELCNESVKCSIEEVGLQMGTTALEIRSVSKLNIFLGAQNLMELFNGAERKIMKLYFASDFDIKKVKGFFSDRKHKANIEEVINNAMEKLKHYLQNDVEDAQEFQYFEVQD